MQDVLYDGHKKVVMVDTVMVIVMVTSLMMT